MFERLKTEEGRAAPVPASRPLPEDFDELLDRLAEGAQRRRLLREAEGATE